MGNLRIGKQATITDLENTRLRPRVLGRIRVLTPDVRKQTRLISLVLFAYFPFVCQMF